MLLPVANDYEIPCFSEKESKEKESKTVEPSKDVVKESPSRSKEVKTKTPIISKYKSNKLRKSVAFEEKDTKPVKKEPKEPEPVAKESKETKATKAVEKELKATQPPPEKEPNKMEIAQEEVTPCKSDSVMEETEPIIRLKRKKESPKTLKKNKHSAAAKERWKVRREKMALLKQQEEEKKANIEIQR